MSGLAAGSRVRWVGPNPTGRTDLAVGTVTDPVKDRSGLVEVRWDGIGTFRDDPINLDPIGE